MCAASVPTWNTQEGPAEMQSVTAFDMVPAKMCGRLYVYLVWMDKSLRGEGCDGWGCQVRHLIGSVFQCATIHRTLVSAGRGHLMRVQPTEEQGLNWRAVQPRGRSPASIYRVLSTCRLPAWRAAATALSTLVEETMFPAPRNTLREKHRPPNDIPLGTHDSPPAADLCELAEPAQSGACPSFASHNDGSPAPFSPRSYSLGPCFLWRRHCQ